MTNNASTFHDPRTFLSKVHPPLWSGNVVVHRNFLRGNDRKALITASQANMAAGRLQNIEANIFISVASFFGRPILINFEKTHAICTQIEIVKGWHETVTTVYEALSKYDLPLPNMHLNDGSIIAFMWYINEPFKPNELHKVLLCQKTISMCLKSEGIEVNPELNSITSLVRLLGTINPKTKKHMGLHKCTEALDRDRFEEAFLSHIRPAKLLDYQSNIHALIDLEKIVRDRALFLPEHPETHIDYVLAFSAALAELCTEDQLLCELQALSETIKGNISWEDIDEGYKNNVYLIAESASCGSVMIDGIYLDINVADWKEIFTNLLRISTNEVTRLGLTTLIPNGMQIQLELTENSSDGICETTPFGKDSFSNIESILLQAVA